MAKASVKTKKTPSKRKKTVPKAFGGATDGNFSNFQLFVAGLDSNGNLVGNTQTKPNGSFTSKWENIKSGPFDRVAAGTRKDGSLAIVTTDPKTNHVHYICEKSAGSNLKNRWDKMIDLGTPKGASPFTTLCIVHGQQGLDNIFASSPSRKANDIWWKFRNPDVIEWRTVTVTPPGSKKPIKVKVPVVVPPKQPWSDWIDISGNLQGGLSDIRAAPTMDGRLLLTGEYFNGINWMAMQNPIVEGKTPSWTDWNSNQSGTDGYDVGGMVPVRAMDGLVNIFAAGAGGRAFRCEQTDANKNSWTPWSTPGILNTNAWVNDVNIDANGKLVWITMAWHGPSPTTDIYANVEVDHETNKWEGWNKIASLTGGDQVSLQYNANGAMSMFGFDSKRGNLSVLNQTKPGSSEWFHQWNQIGSGLRGFSVARDLTP